MGSRRSGSRFPECLCIRSLLIPGEEAAQAARRALGLDPEKFTVFVNAGWEGGGNIPQIFRELVRGELDVQAIFLAGQNEDLRVEAESLASSASFPDQGHWLFRSGRATDERSQRDDFQTWRPDHVRSVRLPPADHCRCNHRADASGSGCCKLIVKRGAGVLLERATDIVPVIRRMVEDTAHYSAMRAATSGSPFRMPRGISSKRLLALIPASECQQSPRNQILSRGRVELSFDLALTVGNFSGFNSPPTKSRLMNLARLHSSKRAF